MRNTRVDLFAVAFALCLFACCQLKGSDELVLAENGNSDYVLVHPDNLATGDVFVVKDVAGLLSTAMGRDFAVTNLSAAPAAKRIFYGIAPKGFDIASLELQEHCVFTVGEDVYLFGGGPNGGRYAAYSMLQKDLGFRFFDSHGGVKYPGGTIRLKKMQSRRKFPFRFRYLNGYSGFLFRPESTIFLFRHGFNSWVGMSMEQHCGLTVPPDECRILDPHAHSLRYYLPANSKESTFEWIKDIKSPDLEKEHPEYFTLDAFGKRVFNSQYCLSNTGCRTLLKERVLENIRRNYPAKNVFDLSAGDTPGMFCHCEGCKALMEKYGTVAGPLVDFLLELCPAVKERYPDVLITSLAYRKTQTQPPPSRCVERMPDNFMPDFAPIDDNFARDWNDSSNTNTYNDLKKWCRLCKDVMVWYYPNPYTGSVTPPLGNVERAVNDLFLMEKAGVTAHLWEHNVGVRWNIGFTELQTYVFARLMNDMSLDWRQLADEFIDFKYGAAGPAFKRYWLELEELRKETPMSMTWNAAPTLYRHLTPECMVRWNTDFDRMEEMVKDDPARLYSIRRVRINLDYAMLLDYVKVKKAGFAMSAEELGARILATGERVATDFCSRPYANLGRKFVNTLKKTLESAILMNVVEPKPLPEEIFGKYAEDHLFMVLPHVANSSYEKDTDAAYGLRAVFTNNGRGVKLPLLAALEDHITTEYHRLGSVSEKDGLPPRGKYKFYNLGKFTLSSDCLFRFGVHNSWDFKMDVSRAWEVGSYNRATGWASLKFEGASFYPEDVGKPNRVFCDRVVIVRE